MSPARRIRLWLPVLVYMVLIYSVSSRSSVSGITEQLSDKLLHAVAYLGLGLLAQRACHGGVGALRRRPALLALLITVSYGLADEWHQSMVPGRHASVWDALADAVGALLAIPTTAALAWVLGRYWQPPRQPEEI